MSENGQLKVGVPIQWVGRLYQVTPDGTQWEVRVIAIGQFPDGVREIGEFTLRSWEGGVEALRFLAVPAGQLAANMAIQKMSGLVVPNKV